MTVPFPLADNKGCRVGDSDGREESRVASFIHRKGKYANIVAPSVGSGKKLP
jgi:hypothetical protein